jgi:hypothetical protein
MEISKMNYGSASCDMIAFKREILGVVLEVIAVSMFAQDASHSFDRQAS